MLEQIFNKLGLSDKETRIYLALLEGGPAVVGRLCKKVGIARTSLYGYLENLRSNNLVKSFDRNGLQTWQAEDPQNIQNRIKQESTDWQDQLQSFKQFMPQLLSKQKTDLLVPKYTYFDGVEAVKQMINDVNSYQDIESIALWPIRSMLGILGAEFLYEHNVQRIKNNIFLRSIWPQGWEVDITKNIFLGVSKDFQREIRRGPQGVDCQMGYWAYENKVAFISSREECFGFIVESIELSQMINTQFEFLWQHSAPIKVKARDTASFIRDNQL